MYDKFEFLDSSMSCPSMVSTVQVFDCSISYSLKDLGQTCWLVYNDGATSPIFSLTTGGTTLSHQYTTSGQFTIVLASNNLYTAPSQPVVVYQGLRIYISSIPEENFEEIVID